VKSKEQHDADVALVDAKVKETVDEAILRGEYLGAKIVCKLFLDKIKNSGYNKDTSAEDMHVLIWDIQRTCKNFIEDSNNKIRKGGIKKNAKK